MSDENTTKAIRARQVFDGQHWHDDAAVLVAGEHVLGLCSLADIPGDAEATELVELLAPGFIDVQVNGGGGVLLNASPTPDGLKTIVAGHRATGTTGMMPTVVSDSRDVAEAAVAAVRRLRAEGELSVLGIHLEGPYLAPEKRGVHAASKLRPLDEDDLNWLISLTDLRVLLTVAPEVVSAEQIARLTQAGIIVSGGHSQASFETTRGAIDAGLTGFTHLFNAMPAVSAREPGILSAALTDRETWAGIIADGHHVHPANIRLAVAGKSPDRIMLVSDAMPTVGADSPCFQLYRETITVENGRLVNSEGKLAGSAIGMSEAVAYSHRTVGIELSDCLRMASTNPARFLGMDDQLGRLSPGYRADLVALDDDLSVSASWVAGRQVYRRGD